MAQKKTKKTRRAASRHASKPTPQSPTARALLLAAQATAAARAGKHSSDLQRAAIAAPNVQAYLARSFDEAPLLTVEEVADALGDIESPIEALFAIGFCRALHTSFPAAAARVEQDLRSHGFHATVASIAMGNQVPMGGAHGNYRIDHVIDVTMDVDEPREAVAEYHGGACVECDGLAYHSTAEQIKRDNRRARDLLAHDRPVMRFTGSEINTDPEACATEAIEIALSVLPDAYNLVEYSGVLCISNPEDPVWMDMRGYGRKEVMDLATFLDRVGEAYAEKRARTSKGGEDHPAR